VSGVSLEGTGDTPYITPYIDYLPNPIKKSNPLKTLAVTHFTL